MKTVLGKKQTSSHTDWLRVFSNIEQYVLKQETDNLLDRLVEQVAFAAWTERRSAAST